MESLVCFSIIYQALPMILHSVFEQLGSYIVLSVISLSCVAIAEAGMLRWRAQCCVG